MSNNQFYKVFQVMEFFVTKYEYISVQIKNLVKTNEIFIVSKDNPNYHLIRITNDSVMSSKYDQERIDRIIDVLTNQFNINNTNVLDIHIGNDEVDDELPYNTICINTDFYKGIDVENIFPGIHHVIKESNNEEEAIKNSITHINESIRNLRQKAKNRSLLKKIKDAKCPCTFIIMIICILLFILTCLLEYIGKYSASASLIVLGGNYTTFTLGLKQYYRLITGAFLHSSLTHLFFNMWSFYVVSGVLERNLGRTKYLIMLFAGILFSSLTASVLNANTLIIGMSGGIYCLFVYLIAFYLGSGFINTRTFIPTILLNLALNFLPGVSWQTHLGGAICGLMFYYIFKDKKVDNKLCIVLFILLVGLGYKYVTEYNIKPYYPGTDSEVCKIYYDLGLKDYSINKLTELTKIYNS